MLCAIAIIIIIPRVYDKYSLNILYIHLGYSRDILRIYKTRQCGGLVLGVF
ncbi:hypothetical protein VII_003779 [Vibrio mimicus MB451]|nr:hypothetical protein VII_003779 [Vibrio mimicus MB451]